MNKREEELIYKNQKTATPLPNVYFWVLYPIYNTRKIAGKLVDKGKDTACCLQ